MAGITPPSDERSRSSRLGDSSFSEPDLAPPPNLPVVPAAATLVQGQRPPGSRPPLITISAGRGRRQDSSSSPSPRGTQRPPELSATQASFLAGAAVTHAHQSAQVALHAASTARREHRTGSSCKLTGSSPAGRTTGRRMGSRCKAGSPKRSGPDPCSGAGRGNPSEGRGPNRCGPNPCPGTGRSNPGEG